MKILKKFVAGILCASLVFGSGYSRLYASAAPVLTKTDKEVVDASIGIMEAMFLVIQNYRGGNVTLDDLYDGALNGMMDELDEYSEYMDDDTYDRFSGYFANEIVAAGLSNEFDFEKNYMKVNRVIEKSPADIAGLKKGDYILSVNGKSGEGLMTYDFYSIVESDPKKLRLTVLRGDTKMDVEMTKEVVVFPDVWKRDIEELSIEKTDSFKNSGLGKLDLAVGYIQIDAIGDNCGEDFKKEVEKLKASGVDKLILDLRSNGGGKTDEALEICKLIIPKGPIIYKASKNNSMTPVNSTLAVKPFKKIVVLVDGNTASAAEIITSAIKESGAGIVVGRKTYGKGVEQTLYALSSGGVVKFTTSEIFSRNKNRINKIGITPNFTVERAGYVTTLELNANKAAEGVVNLKKALEVLGYSISEKGNVYTDELAEVIKSYQQKNSLNSDGKLSDETMSSISISLYRFYAANDLDLFKAYTEIIK